MTPAPPAFGMTFDEALDAILALEKAWAEGFRRLCDFGIFPPHAEPPQALLIGVPQAWRSFAERTRRVQRDPH